MSLKDYENSTTGKYEDFKYVESGKWHRPLQNEWVAYRITQPGRTNGTNYYIRLVRIF